MKKIKILSLAIAVALIATIVSGFIRPAMARTWPENISEWDEDDWADFWWYYAMPYYQYEPYNYNYGYNNYGYNNYNSYNYNNPANAYSGYNFYNGILDIYDAASEYQAQVLAKIINLYAHGVASQTQQAGVGWTVMNSVDASPGNDIGSIAPLFHYDANRPTTDDFGRDLMPLARDIIFRWKAGRAGVSNNGRVLPTDYVFVWSTGNTVAFRNNSNANSPAWGFSYTTPYGN